MGGEDAYKGRGVRRRKQRAGVGAVPCRIGGGKRHNLRGGNAVGRVGRERLDPVTGLDARCSPRGRRHSERCSKCGTRHRRGRPRRCPGGVSANERCKSTTERNVAFARSGGSSPSNVAEQMFQRPSRPSRLAERGCESSHQGLSIASSAGACGDRPTPALRNHQTPTSLRGRLPRLAA